MAQKIKIYGQEYQLSEGLENFGKIKREFQELSSEYESKFIEELMKKCDDVQDMVDNASKIANRYFEKIEEMILTKLTSNGVYTVKKSDVTKAASECGVFEGFEKTLSNLEEACSNINARVNYAREQREMRKEYRGRVIGGGFGISNAMKGMVQASIINGAVGLGHSFVNAIGNARSEREARERLEDMYPVARIGLKSAFSATIRNYHIVMIVMLDKYEIETFELPSNEDRETAKAMMENLEAGRIPKNKMKQVLFQILSLDPFSKAPYFYALEQYGDAKKELEQFAKIHEMNVEGIKESVVGRKYERYINKLIDFYDGESDPETRENDLVNLQENISNEKEKLGLDTITAMEKQIEEEMNKLEKAYKTVEGIVFKSVKEANAAKKDLRKFYRFISIHGVDSDSICDEVRKLDFETSIITDKLEERIADLKLLKNEAELGKRIKKVYKNHNVKPSYRTFIISKSGEEYCENASRARRLAKIHANEKIAIIFKKESYCEGDFLWWTLTNCNLYIFENDGSSAKEKMVIPYRDIDTIYVDEKGTVFTRIRGKGDISTKLDLRELQSDDVSEGQLSEILKDILNLVAPLTEGRDADNKERKVDVVPLEIEHLSKNTYWDSIKNDRAAKEFVCVNDGSDQYKKLLYKVKQFWRSDFDDETIYFIMLSCSLGPSIVFTSKQIYVTGIIRGYDKKKYIFPIDKIDSFEKARENKEYQMFFEPKYYKENYWDYVQSQVTWNTIKFNMFNISESVASMVCKLLTSLGEEMRKPMKERVERKKYFEKSIENASGTVKIGKIISEIENDKMLDEDDRKEFLLKAKEKEEKCIKSETNKFALEQLVSSVNKEDVYSINKAINQIVSDKSLGKSRTSAISKLVDMQLDIGNKLYRQELKKFFEQNGDNCRLILNKPVYMKSYKGEAAETMNKEICSLLITNSLIVGDDEVMLVLFTNDSQTKSVSSELPQAIRCLITNKRLIAEYKNGKYESCMLSGMDINASDIKVYNCIRDKDGKKVSICFPYVKVDEIVDKTIRSYLRDRYGDKEHTIVANELKELVDGICKKTVEINQSNVIIDEIIKKSDKVYTLSRQELEKEYANISKYAKYGEKVKNYLEMLEGAIKEVYTKEAKELCEGIENMSMMELKELKKKFDETFSNKKFADLVNSERKFITDELQKKEDMAIKVEIQADAAKVASLSSAELEKMLDKWSGHTEKLEEAKELTNSIHTALKAVCKKEAQDMCVGHEEISLKEAEELLEKIKTTFRNKDYIKEELAMVEETIVKKQELDIQMWMPEKLDALNEKELTDLIVKLKQGHYVATTYDKYVTPVLEARRRRIVEKAEQIATYIKQEAASLHIPIKFASNQEMLSDLSKQVDIHTDTLVCTMGLMPYGCQIYTKKCIFDNRNVYWEEMLNIEYKKKFFGSSIEYCNKAGTRNEMKIVLPSVDMADVAGLMKKIQSFVLNYGTKVALNAAPQPKAMEITTNIVSQSQGIVTNTSTEMAKEIVTYQQPVEQPQELVIEVPEKSEVSGALSVPKHNYADMVAFVNKFPSVINKTVTGSADSKFSKKIKSAVKAYASTVREEEVFALFDDTLFGSGKEGFIMTTKGIYVKTSFTNAFNCTYSDINSIKVIYDMSLKLTKVILDTSKGKVLLSASCGDTGSDMLAERINKIVQYLFGLEALPYDVEKSSQEKVNLY